jgi:SAM-dependent methyltransferase
MTASNCQFCRETARVVVFDYSERPEGETIFPFLEGKPYHRQVVRCVCCGHFTSICTMDISGLYDDAYVNATYQDESGVRQTFNRIINLPPEKSDNVGRVDRVDRFAGNFLAKASKKRLLDIGAGLAVFPWGMKNRGWDCVALDPDPRTAAHARSVAGVNAICADFLKDPVSERFPLITLNKVLEHVPDPILMLRKASEILESGGLIYIELPDGEAACAEGPDREEFFIEHLHVFSMASLTLLAFHADLKIIYCERYREPSGKFTLNAFCITKRP